MEPDNNEPNFPSLSTEYNSIKEIESNDEQAHSKIYNHCSCWYHLKPNEDEKWNKSTNKVQNKNHQTKYTGNHFTLYLLTFTTVVYIFIGSILIIFYENEIAFPDNGKKTTLPVAFLFGKSIDSELTDVQSTDNVHNWLASLHEYEQNKKNIVQNIWNITVSLNILYHQNWTVLANQELILFQNQVEQTFWNEKSRLTNVNAENDYHMQPDVHDDEPPMHWKMAKAFLQSLCIISTIGLGYGEWLANLPINIKLTFVLYSSIGVPLMYLYLSKMAVFITTYIGQLFSYNFFFCCCSCLKCHFCCYETLMTENEKKLKYPSQSSHKQSTDYSYQIDGGVVDAKSFKTFTEVKPFISTPSQTIAQNYPTRNQQQCRFCSFHIIDGSATEKYSRFLYLSIVCVTFGVLYLVFGSFILLQFDVDWFVTDSLYFIFMFITTIGTKDNAPSKSALNIFARYRSAYDSIFVWMFSFYLMIGLLFSATCYNTLQNCIKRDSEN